MSLDSLVWGVSWLIFVLTLVLQAGTEKSLLLESWPVSQETMASTPVFKFVLIG